jgi:hypothetical protein
MKPSPANLRIAEIFALWPAIFCRVAGAAAGNCRLILKNMPVLKTFMAAPDFSRHGTPVAKQPLRTKLK